MIVFLRRAIERRPPFREGPIAVDDRRDPDGGNEIAYRKPIRLAEFVSVESITVRVREHPLADTRVAHAHESNGADGVACLALLDVGFVDAVHPYGVSAKITNDGPYGVRGVIEYGAVIGFCHDALLEL